MSSHLPRWCLTALVFFLGTIGAAVGVALVLRQIPLLSPVTNSTSFQFLPRPSTQNQHARVVYGFLPYWNVKKVTLQPELTHLSYFAFTIGADGSILTRTRDGESESGFRRWTSEEVLELLNEQRAHGGKVEIVLSQFQADDIASFLTNPAAHERLFTSLDSILLAYPVDGINIDIEYAGSSALSLRDHFTKFTRSLHDHVRKKYPKTTLSVDVYASAASTGNIWDMKAVQQYVDYVIVMAYDFHRRSSPVAGPVAPLFGGRELWDSDITQHLRDLLEQVPKQKILLGVPFYGYEWQTTSRDSQAHTFPETGSTASFERVQEILQEKKDLDVQESWNENALSPYLTYQKDARIFVIYYENSRSVSYKLDLVNQLDLGGVAIWALGYESNSRELWDVIGRKFGRAGINNP